MNGEVRRDTGTDSAPISQAAHSAVSDSGHTVGAMSDEQWVQGRSDEPAEDARNQQSPAPHEGDRSFTGSAGQAEGTDRYAQPGGSGGPPHGAPYSGAPYAPPWSAGPYGSAQDPGQPYGGGRPAGTPGAGGRSRRPRSMGGIVAAALIAGLIGGGAGFGGAYALLEGGSSSSGVTLNGVPASTTVAAVANGTIAAAAQQAIPSTVDIRVPVAQGIAEGSGVILTADGAVLTNNHVVDGATGPIGVTLADGSQHAATVVGTSPSYDLAVLKLQNVSGLTPATLGRSQDVQVGEQVVAIGSPQGLTGTVTAGIVSALNRTVAVQGDNGAGVVYNGLQTDAPINQGNSGGPLVNLDGQVVGINSAIATAGSQSTGSIGLGFTIPVDQARRVAQEILDTGHATKPVLGVQGSTGGSRSVTAAGATIAQVVPGLPAANAGLAAGDLVTKVGSASVNDFSDLVARIGGHSPGDKVTLTVKGGDGNERAVDVTLGSTVDQGATTTSGGSTTPFGGQSPFGVNPFGGGH